MNRSSSWKVDGVPASDLKLSEVNSDGGYVSPRRAGSFKLSQAVAAEREETRKRLSRELVGRNIRKLNHENNGDDDDEEEDNEDEEEDEEDDEGLLGTETPGGTKMSLMDLLEETDRRDGIHGPAFRLGGDVEEEEVEEEDVFEDDGKGGLCCVCKVKHRGSAIIPCGHTFCRLCSKELWVEKGNCPICNDFVAEVLDVF